MKASVKLFALLAMVFAIGACDEFGEIPTPNIPLSDVQFNIDAIPAGDFTKATDTAFEKGDAVSIYGFKGSANSSASSWLPWLSNGKFTKGDGGFTPDQTYYWYQGEEKGIIIGLYPYNANYTAEALISTGVEFCVKSDQSTHAGYTASDLMTAYKPEVTPTSEKVVLEFDHLLSKLVIDINNQTSEGVKEVYIDGVKGNLNYSLGLGVTLKDGVGTIKAGKLATASNGYTDTYVLITPPQTVAPSIAITTTSNKQYTYNAPENIEFGIGKVRHLTVTITEESISTEIDAIVNDWSADESVEFTDQNGGGEGGGNNGEGGDPETPSGITPIADILALGSGATIQSATIEAVVISNKDLNNLTSKKGLYVQDESAGLQFYLSANHDFAFGDKVQIDLSGATIGEYSGATQISGVAVEKITKLSSGNAVAPRLVTINDFLNNKYESQYVAIIGVQVAEADLGKTWVMDGSHTSITIEDALGNTFVAFSSKYATYGAQTVAQGSGAIKGIAGYNNGKIQIIFAQESDFAEMNNERISNESIEMRVNPNWTIEHLPEFIDEDGTLYNDICHIRSTSDEGFFLEFYSLDDWNNSIAPNKADFVQALANNLVQNITEYNQQNGTTYDLTAFKYYFNTPLDLYYILQPGTWVATVWGITPEGEVTGLYAASEPMEVIDENAAYNAWLGTWKISDANAYSTITLTADVVGESYNMEGWNNLWGLPTKVLYSAEAEAPIFCGQVVGSNIELADGSIIEQLYFVGVGTNGKLYASEYLAQGVWFREDSTSAAMIVPYQYTYTDEATGENVDLTFSQIGYIMTIQGSESLYYATEQMHSFADGGLSMIRVTDAAQSRAKYDLEGDKRFKRLTRAPHKDAPISGLFVAGECRFNF
ncbi:MAG: fimbrillin family protein [Tidjanibacter sp.]|nr:fimbrillin family protein [Tidjanibacter sp.]